MITSSLRAVSICLLFLLAAGSIPAWAEDAQAVKSPGEAVAQAPNEAALPSPDEKTESEESAPAEPKSGARQTIEANLADVLLAKTRLEADLVALQAELRSDRARGREEELVRDIRQLAQEQLELDRSFSALASGFDPAGIALDHEPATLNLTDELRDLLGPLVNELKRATSRPREIDASWRSSRWADSLVSSSVEFQTAGASSLDLFVRVDLDGANAIDLEGQKRLLASFCVDVCNEQGWSIPFSQLTLHVAPSAGDSTH